MQWELRVVFFGDNALCFGAAKSDCLAARVAVFVAGRANHDWAHLVFPIPMAGRARLGRAVIGLSASGRGLEMAMLTPTAAA